MKLAPATTKATPIQRSNIEPALVRCRVLVALCPAYAAVQRQIAVTAYLKSKQLLLFVFAL